MNILFLNTGNAKGGVLSWIETLSKGLNNKGHKSYFAVSIKGDGYDVLSLIGEVFMLPRTYSNIFPRYILGLPFYSPIKIIKNWYNKRINSRFIDGLIEKYSIDRIITNGFISIPNIKNSNTKILTVLHTVPSIDITPFKLKSRYIGYKLSKADHIIAVGSVIIERLSKYTRKEITLIPNGSQSFLMYNNRSITLKQRFGISEDSFCIGTIGRFSKQKGFKEVIEVFERLAPIHKKLHCVLGGGPVGVENTAYFNEVMSYARSSSYSDRIHLLGEVDNKTFYPLIDIFILYNIDSIESFGLVIIEAMSAGIPVICTGKGGPLDIINHEKNGFLVYNNSVESFVFYAEKLILDEKLNMEIVSNGKLKFKLNYSLDVFISNWIRILKK